MTAIRQLGTIRWGPPAPAQDAALTSSDSARVDALLPRVLSATSWDDLLAV